MKMVSVLIELSWHASVRLTVFYMHVNLPNGYAVTDTDFLWEDETGSCSPVTELD